MIVQEEYPDLIKQWINRMITRERIAHAYLFIGKRGVGKRNMAIFFAQALFCQQKVGADPCLSCSECQRIAHSNHPDVHWLKPDGQSIKIEQIRDLQKEFSFRGLETEQKVYIIDQVQTLTAPAANSLLKFLEEPHPGTVAILLTEGVHQLLPTLLSRCQQIVFPAPSPTQLIRQLSPDYGQALVYTVSHLTSDLEEAVSLCQAEWFAELRNLMIQLTEELFKHKGSTQSLFQIQDQWLIVAKEREQLDIGLELLLFWYRDLLYTHIHIEDKCIYLDQKERISKQAQSMSKEKIAQCMDAILQAKRSLQAHVHPQLLLEQLVFRLQGG